MNTTRIAKITINSPVDQNEESITFLSAPAFLGTRLHPTENKLVLLLSDGFYILEDQQKIAFNFNLENPRVFWANVVDEVADIYCFDARNGTDTVIKLENGVISSGEHSF